MVSTRKLKQSSIDAFLNVSETLKPTSDRRSFPKTGSPSDYERLRDETIRRNRDFLQKLGIALASPSPKSLITKRVGKPTPTAVPLRRSARQRGSPPPPPSAEDAFQPHLPSGIQLVDSSVFRYACIGANDPLFISAATVSDSSILGFKVVGRGFRDPSLSKIYTMDDCRLEHGSFLVAAGGGGGFISVYGGKETAEEEDDSETERPLMSWKGSRSWVSGVMFMENNPMVLISSSNDGKITAWDVKKQQNPSSTASCLPPAVAEAESVHSSGIFSMDRFEVLVATASKDSSVGISRLSAAGELVAERNISGHHHGAIRGVCFGDGRDKLADCGADGRMCILDTRQAEPCAITIESHYSTGINTIEWCKTNKFLLLSASKDPVLLLYDIRSYSQPLHKLSGHVDSRTRVCQHIYRPSFVEEGKAVATPGEGSEKISIYSVETGKLLSQGSIGYDANLVRSAGKGAACGFIWAAGRQINQLSPIRYHLD